MDSSSIYHIDLLEVTSRGELNLIVMVVTRNQQTLLDVVACYEIKMADI
jgi:hypothetical protein